ncbi:hypothetical protein ACFQX7_23905 [Luedemannella flava]
MSQAGALAPTAMIAGGPAVATSAVARFVGRVAPWRSLIIGMVAVAAAAMSVATAA